MAEAKTTDKIEREYIIPLRHRWKIVPRYQRTNKAVRSVKEFLVRHMKIRDRDLSKIRLDRYLNETLWHRGIKNPPAKIKVMATREGEIVRVSAVDMPNNIKFKKIREERLIGSSKKVAEKRKEEKKISGETSETPKVEGDEEKKTEEKENKSAIVEAGREMEKAAAKQMKHQPKQAMKQPKHQVRMALEK
jgi:large subunit ribosomal protein L31e